MKDDLDAVAQLMPSFLFIYLFFLYCTLLNKYQYKLYSGKGTDRMGTDEGRNRKRGDPPRVDEGRAEVSSLFIIIIFFFNFLSFSLSSLLVSGVVLYFLIPPVNSMSVFTCQKLTK